MFVIMKIETIKIISKADKVNFLFVFMIDF